MTSTHTPPTAEALAAQRARDKRLGITAATRGTMEQRSRSAKPAPAHLAAISSTRAATQLDVAAGVSRGIRESQMTPATAETRYARAFARYLRTGQESAALLERRDLGEATGAAGGFLVPKQLYRGAMLTEMKAQTWPLLANATIIETPTFTGPMNQPVLSDGSVTASAVGENTLLTETGDVTLGNIAYGECGCYTCSMRMSIALSQDIDQDDLDSVVNEAWQLRSYAGVELDATATVIAGCSATTTGNAGTLVYQDLVNAYFAVSPLYRSSAIFVFSTAAMKALRSLVDATTLRPVLLDQPVRTVNDAFSQSTLVPFVLGVPCYESNAFDNAVSPGKNVGWFGSPKHVLPIRRGPASLQVLNERYVDYNQKGLIGRMYFDASQLGIAAAGTVIKVHA